MQGRYAEAKSLYERSQAMQEKVLGPEHPDVALSLTRRARLLKSQVRVVGGLKICLYCPQMPVNRCCFISFAPLHVFQGKYEEAEPLFERSQAIREKVLGQEHPDVAESLSDRAGLLASRVRVVRGSYLDTVHIAYNTGQHYNLSAFPCRPLPHNTPLHVFQGKYAEAEPLFERSQAIREKALGQEHPDVAESLSDRAGLLASWVRVVRGS